MVNASRFIVGWKSTFSLEVLSDSHMLRDRSGRQFPSRWDLPKEAKPMFPRNKLVIVGPDAVGRVVRIPRSAMAGSVCPSSSSESAAASEKEVSRWHRAFPSKVGNR